jgi:hypothetical protein
VFLLLALFFLHITFFNPNLSVADEHKRTYKVTTDSGESNLDLNRQQNPIGWFYWSVFHFMLHTLQCFLITTEIWCVKIQGDACRMKPKYLAIGGERLPWLPFNCLQIPGHCMPSPASFITSASCDYFCFPCFQHDHTVDAPCPTQLRSFGLLCEPTGLSAHTAWH